MKETETYAARNTRSYGTIAVIRMQCYIRVCVCYTLYESERFMNVNRRKLINLVLLMGEMVGYFGNECLKIRYNVSLRNRAQYSKVIQMIVVTDFLFGKGLFTHHFILCYCELLSTTGSARCMCPLEVCSITKERDV